MCGIIGIVSTEAQGWQDRKGFFEDGLLCSQLRGTDGTGMYGFSWPSGKRNTKERTNKDLYFFSYKKGLPAADFVQLKLFKDMMMFADNCPLIVGHTRAKTRADVRDENAHPFHAIGRWGKVALVHNGFVSNHAILPGVAERTGTFDVDSESICYALAEKGPLEVLPRMEGAYALAFINRNTQTLYLTANGARPLSFAFIEGQNTMIFASEETMLMWVAERNNLEIEEKGLHYIDKRIEKIKGPFPDNEYVHLYAFDLDNVRDFKAHPETKFDIKVERKFFNNNGYHNHSRNQEPAWLNEVDGPDYDDYHAMGYGTPHYNGRVGPPIGNNGRNLIPFRKRDSFLLSHGGEEGEYVPFFPYSASATHQKSLFEVRGFTYSGHSKRWIAVLAHAVRRDVLAELAEEFIGDDIIFKRDAVLYGSLSHVATLNMGNTPTVHTVILLSPSITIITEVDSEKVNWVWSDDWYEPLKDVERPATVAGPQGSIITVEEYLHLTSEGCSACGSTINIKDSEEIIWEKEVATGHYEPVCAKCVADFDLELIDKARS